MAISTVTLTVFRTIMDSAPYPFSCHIEAVPESLSCREGPAQSWLEDTRTKVMGWRPPGAYMPLTFLDDGQTLLFKNTHLWELVSDSPGAKGTLQTLVGQSGPGSGHQPETEAALPRPLRLPRPRLAWA